MVFDRTKALSPFTERPSRRSPHQSDGQAEKYKTSDLRTKKNNHAGKRNRSRNNKLHTSEAACAAEVVHGWAM
jgi:hypothetical protein